MLLPLMAVATAAALVSGSVVKPAQNNPGTFELLILHNNDMHARFEQTSQLSGACTTEDRDIGKCYGGFPRVAHVVKEARKAAATGEGPPVLYLNAGDTYTGTAWFTIYKWKIAAEFINALQPDAVSLGNHEFDDGISGLSPFIKNITTPVLAANLILKNEPALDNEPNLMKSVVFNINGTKIGVIGYLTKETKYLAKQNNIEYEDEVHAIRQEINKLKTQNVKIFIGLGHSGYLRDLDIARNVEDLDVIIGGHTNTFLWNGDTPDSETIEGPYPTVVNQTSGRKVLVVQAYAYTKYLGKLDVIFDSNGEIVNYSGMPVLLDNSIPQDPEVLKIIDMYSESVKKVSEVVVGSTSVILDQKSCKYKECNLGNLITDAMVEKRASEYVRHGWTDAPIAVIQRGGIRAPIAHINLPANITKGDLINVLPFDDQIMKVNIQGRLILRMLEYSVKRYKPFHAAGEFLQMSGMKVVFDLEKNHNLRVVSVSLRCGECEVPEYLPLNVTKEYTILMSSFLALGGDGYAFFRNLTRVPLNYNELDATTEYVQRHSPLFNGIEDRITLKNMHKVKSAATLSTYSTSFIIALLVVAKSV